MRRTHRVISLCTAVLLLVGCAAMETQFPGLKGKSKQVGGALVGAVAGGLLGSQVGKGKGRTLATIVGAAGGAWIGSKIGAQLDAADRAALEAESARALSDAKDGQPVQWSSTKSGASATLTPQRSRTEQRNITVLRDKRVVPAPQLEIIGEPYIAIKNANVRIGPNASAERVGGLHAGEEFTAVGRVTGTRWVMVAKHKVSVGYVYEPLVQPSAQKTVPELRQAINLDDVEGAEDTKVSGIDLDGVDLDVDVVAYNIAVETQCRTLVFSVTGKDGNTKQDQFDACRGGDGAWEIN